MYESHLCSVLRYLRGHCIHVFFFGFPLYINQRLFTWSDNNANSLCIVYTSDAIDTSVKYTKSTILYTSVRLSLASGRVDGKLWWRCIGYFHTIAIWLRGARVCDVNNHFSSVVSQFIRIDVYFWGGRNYILRIVLVHQLSSSDSHHFHCFTFFLLSSNIRRVDIRKINFIVWMCRITEMENL